MPLSLPPNPPPSPPPHPPTHQVRVVGAATYVVVSEESLQHPSCLLVNALPPGCHIHAHQHGCKPSGALVVDACSSHVVCWDEPHMPRVLLVLPPPSLRNPTI
jgi:hypothetical protein